MSSQTRPTCNVEKLEENASLELPGFGLYRLAGRWVPTTDVLGSSKVAPVKPH